MIEETLDIRMRDGAMETFLCRPERGSPAPAKACPASPSSSRGSALRNANSAMPGSA